MKLCPFCAEEIQDAAIVCKHCRRDLPKPPPPEKDRPIANGVSVNSRGEVLSTSTGGVTQGQPVSQKSKTSSNAVGCLLIVVCLGIAALLIGVGLMSGGAGSTRDGQTSGASASGNDSATAGRTASRPAPEPMYELKLISFSCSEESSYGIISGQVKNVTDAPLKNVTAVGTWFDKNGTFIRSDDSMVDYNPILPGQTSPFKTMSTGNPAMAKCNVEFKYLFGGTLSVDRRK